MTLNGRKAGLGKVFEYPDFRFNISEALRLKL